MNYFRFFFVSILLIVFLFSCIKPPEGMEKVNVIDFMKEILDTTYSLKDDENKRNDYINNLMKNFQTLLVLYKDSTINIRSREAKPGADDIGYSLSNNRFKLIKPVYITFEKKDLMFSFDNKIWYFSKSDTNKKIEALYQNINYESKVDNNNIFIEYDATFKLGRNPLKGNITAGKETTTLTKGMILSSPDMAVVTNNLDKSILYIPANSIVAANLMIDGNIMKSYTANDSMVFKSMTDLYLFFKKNMFSISFDHKNWNSNIFSFDINPLFEVRVNEDKLINFNIVVSANYYNNRVSLSIVKLLLSMRR